MAGEVGIELDLQDLHIAVVGDDQGRGRGKEAVSYTHLDVYKRQPLFTVHPLTFLFLFV